MLTKTKARLSLEPGGWLVLRRPAKRISDPLKLLAGSVKPQPGNLRFATVADTVCQVAELRDPAGEFASASDADHDLQKLFLNPAIVAPVGLEVAEILTETPGEWAPVEEQEDRWQGVMTDPRAGRCELAANPCRRRC